MSRELEAQWDQVHAFPPCIEDWIGPEHPARYIREFVEQLDLAGLGFECHTGKTEGRPGYATRLLLRAWLYGYVRKIRSSRELERGCRDEMGLIWLCGTHRPDHNTLWRFWNRHRKQIGKVFVQTVKVAMDLQMVGFVTQAVDGTKIQAVCSSRGKQGADGLDKLLERLERQIGEQEQQLEQNRRSEQLQFEDPSLPAELRTAKDLREKIIQARKAISDGEANYVQPTEPQARRMLTEGGRRGSNFAYNAQAVVDQNEQIITAAAVSAQANDCEQLDAMIEQAAQNSGERTGCTLADGGYSSGKQIDMAQRKDHTVVMPLPASSKNPHNNAYHASQFRHDRHKDVMICPQGRELKLLQERTRADALVRIYQSPSACRGCAVRSLCTKQARGRSIEVNQWYDAIEQHRQYMASEPARELYRQRAGIVEPVFAWIKNHGKMRRWSVRGLDKVQAQWLWLCTAQNLRRLIARWSAQTAPMATA